MLFILLHLMTILRELKLTYATARVNKYTAFLAIKRGGRIVFSVNE